MNLLSSLRSVALFAPLAAGCGLPQTSVVLENDYSPSSATRLTIYDGAWEAVSFSDAGLAPGASSAPETTVPCSANTAYVVLAPDWDPTSSTPPRSFIVLQSRSGFGVNLGDTLDIPVDDTTFEGNCAAGSPLTQAQADFITQEIFPGDFTALHYDAATCVTTRIGDGGAP